MMQRISLPAKRYAKALYESYSDSAVIKSLEADMKVLQAGFSNAGLVDYVVAPYIDNKTKQAKLTTIFSKLVGKETLAFLAFLSFKKRINLLPEVVASYILLAEEKAGVKRVLLEVAYAFDKDLIEKISQVLEQKLNKKIKLSIKVDPKLIGGFKYMVDGYSYDCSLQGKVDSLKKILI